MKKTSNIYLLISSLFIFITLARVSYAQPQPQTPVSQWKNKTILFVGAHPDDDSQSHGTMAMLQDHGNQVYVLLLTTGNVGTKDPTMTRTRLAKIRRGEEVGALKALGIPEDHYINLGYTDGMVQYVPKKSVVRRIVYWIRKLQPDVMIDFDPGYGFRQWHKTDHRAAGWLGTDAARIAEWRLLFQSQIINEGLKAHWIKEYLFYTDSGLDKYRTTKVDITPYVKQKVNAAAQYISQFSSAWVDYRGPKPSDLPGDQGKKYMEKIRNRIHRNDRNGKTYEAFRYYTGSPDQLGARNVEGMGGIEIDSTGNDASIKNK